MRPTDVEARPPRERCEETIRPKVEHVFAQSEAHLGMAMRTIRLARDRAAITRVNLIYDTTRYRYFDRRSASADLSGTGVRSSIIQRQEQLTAGREGRMIHAAGLRASL